MEDHKSQTDDVQLRLESGKMKIAGGSPRIQGSDLNHSHAHEDGHASHGHAHHDHAAHHHAPRHASNIIPLSSITERPARRLDLKAVRARLAGKSGAEYWRSLDELADTDEFQELLEREFPMQAPRDMSPLSRRDFMKFMGASLALAGLAGCARQPVEKIVPYIRQPEEIIPGKPLFFATAMVLGGYANGILAENNMGRPTKIEGNPDHPASQGATDAIMQASLLSLYDPDRSQELTYQGNIATWEEFLGATADALGNWRSKQGAGLRFLTENITSPTLASQLKALLAAFPQAKWHQYEPVNRDNVRAGARLAFNDDVNPVYHFDKADVILSLDADFLSVDPGRLRYARDFAKGRKVRAGQTRMNRLYVVESTPTITGAVADHRLPMQPSQVEAFARTLAQQLGVAGINETSANAASEKWLAALAKDLQSHRGTSLVVAGDHQPPIVHALAHAINGALGNAGKTVTYITPVEANLTEHTTSLSDLVKDMNAGHVETLVVLSGNPVFTAPVDLKFLDAFKKVPLRVHLGHYNDETAQWCHWHIPESHYLEAWSDARAYDGTATIMQPLILPLYEQTQSAHEVLAVFLNQPNRTSYDIVRGYWADKHRTGDFEKFWEKAVHDGIVPHTAARQKPVTLKANFAAATPPPSGPSSGLEIIFRPDPCIWDGRYANNGWLQELPKPLTKLTWDNALLVSPKTAESYNVVNSDLVELTYNGRTVRAPIWIMPGHADNSVTIYLGYGRTRSGKVGDGTGFNTYALRTSDAPWIGHGVQLKPTGDTYHLVSTQIHHSMEGRNLARGTVLDNFLKNPAFAQDEDDKKQKAGELPEMFGDVWPSDVHSKHPVANREAQEEGYARHQWGMAIDLNSCIGCNACVIGCQSENNIPTVGKDQVNRQREMHWIRIDTYYKGDLENPETLFQPLTCMQCEKAPCEPVCPVEATSHSAEGINEQTYNRCIGTRYCSNNCPYKVRRFNFLQFSDQESPTIKLMANPDVTVRSRGVMEKCNYCLQRVTEARIQAEREQQDGVRPDGMIKDGEVVTACQQACPTDAITFGNISDVHSQVSKLKAQPLNYSLLAELDTRPRTTYLARVRNPNPDLEPPGTPEPADIPTERES